LESTFKKSSKKLKKEVAMLTVTESAKQLLKETLLAHSDDPEAVPRLSMMPPGQLGIMLDSETEGDQVVEHEGVKVLLVASELAPVVDRVTLDVQDTPEGSKLVVFRE
jgi:Fe-S cluster assembly iron-binding protein IscA